MSARLLRGLALLMLLTLFAGTLAACSSNSDDDDPSNDSRDEDEDDDRGNDDRDSDDDDEPTEDEDNGEDDDDGPIGDDGDGGCRVTITGDIELEWEGSDDSSAIGTDHWLSEDERREILALLGSDDDEIDEIIEEGRPIISVLVLNCTGDGTNENITLLPSADTTLHDVPQGEGTYPIAGGLLGGAAEPGEFSVFFAIEDEGLIATASEEGELVITHWDDERIEGEFTFGIEESFATGDPRTAQVHGTFEFTCKDSEVCN